jgi:hypothetical protein
MSFSLLLMSALQQNWGRGQNRFCLEVSGGGGEREGVGGREGQMAQTMYAHMNKKKVKGETGNYKSTEGKHRGKASGHWSW